MQFHIPALLVTLAVMAAPAAASWCETYDGFYLSGKVYNCCYGKDGKSCRAQGNGRRWCKKQKANFCSNVFVQNTNRKVSESCDADCCDIKTGWGMPCPK